MPELLLSSQSKYILQEKDQYKDYNVKIKLAYYVDFLVHRTLFTVVNTPIGTNPNTLKKLDPFLRSESALLLKNIIEQEPKFKTVYEYYIKAQWCCLNQCYLQDKHNFEISVKDIFCELKEALSNAIDQETDFLKTRWEKHNLLSGFIDKTMGWPFCGTINNWNRNMEALDTIRDGFFDGIKIILGGSASVAMAIGDGGLTLIPSIAYFLVGGAAVKVAEKVLFKKSDTTPSEKGEEIVNYTNALETGQQVQKSIEQSAGYQLAKTTNWKFLTSDYSINSTFNEKALIPVNDMRIILIEFGSLQYEVSPVDGKKIESSLTNLDFLKLSKSEVFDGNQIDFFNPENFENMEICLTFVSNYGNEKTLLLFQENLKKETQISTIIEAKYLLFQMVQENTALEGGEAAQGEAAQGEEKNSQEILFNFYSDQQTKEQFLEENKIDVEDSFFPSNWAEPGVSPSNTDEVGDNENRIINTDNTLDSNMN